MRRRLKSKKKVSKATRLSPEQKDLNNFLKSLGAAMEKYRKLAGKTQAAMEDVGIDLRSWGRFVAGSRDMRMSTLLKICRSLNLSPERLLSEVPWKGVRMKG